jgi:hypothetical protein
MALQGGLDPLHDGDSTGKAIHNYLSVYTIWSPTEYYLQVLRGTARVGRVVWLTQAAESKGPQNEYFKLKKLIACDQHILNHWDKYKEIQ